MRLSVEELPFRASRGLVRMGCRASEAGPPTATTGHPGPQFDPNQPPASGIAVPASWPTKGGYVRQVEKGAGVSRGAAGEANASAPKDRHPRRDGPARKAPALRGLRVPATQAKIHTHRYTLGGASWGH